MLSLEVVNGAVAGVKRDDTRSAKQV